MRWLTWVVITLTLIAGVSLLMAADETTVALSVQPDGRTGDPLVKVLAKTSRGMTLELEIPSLEVTSVDVGGRAFQALALPDGGTTGDLGRAELPTYTRLVALPVGAAVRVALTDKQMTSLSRMDLAPRQPVAEAGKAAPAVALDAAWYARAPRTEATVAVGEPALMHGVRVVPVTFSPVSYDPGTGGVAAARSMTVQIDFFGRDDTNNPAHPGRLIPQSFAAMLEDLVIGYERDADVATVPGSYLLICPNNSAVLTALQPLVDWRSRQGYNVVVATTAQTGTTNTAIKAYIQNAYNTYDPPLEFVTLVGDANGSVTIPCWYENISGYGGEGDLDYALLEGGDILADVHLGRLSVTSSTELTNVVNKIVNYEVDPDLSDSWFTTAGLTGDPSSSGYSCVWVQQFVKESLQHIGYTRIDTIFSGNFVSQMLATINQGESLFTYRGYWNMSGMTYSHILSTTNGRQLPFAVILTCDTGSFSTDGTCRSEAFLRATNGGGVASIGTATIGTHTRYNNCIFLGVTHGVLNTGEHRVGPACTRGRLNLYTNYIVNEPSQAQIWSHWNNLMGDPATDMWTGTPATLTVVHPAALNALANAIPVNVTRGGQPLAGAQVTAFQSGHVRATASTDAAGNAVLPITGVVNGSLLVTVSGHNLKPYRGTTTIGTVTSSLDFAALTLGDAGGNANGLANPGEPLTLDIQLANHGSASLTGVNGTLSSPEPWALVTTASRGFGTIAGGASAWSQDAYGVTLAASAPGGQTVPLRLDATSGASTWTSVVPVTVTGPRGQISRTTFSGPGGNLDPGESGNILIDLNNIGNLATTGITATLSCSSQWVTVTDPNGAWGPVAAGGQGTMTNPFAISISTDCYPGHLANFTVDLIFAEGGVGTVEFQKVIGTSVVGDPTGPDAYGYYIFDNADTDPNAPTYSWFDIAAIGTNTGINDSGSYGDDTRTFDLPFPFTMYGESFTKVSICSNGWLALGRTYQRLYRNWHLPSDGGPGNMVCAFWDDLAQGTIYTYNDVANHRYVVQWEGFGSETGGGYSGNCTFQIMLYDPAYHGTETGDGPIVIQYESISIYNDETTYFTTGLQNGPRTTGVTYAYGNHYDAGAATIAAGRALRIVPIVPQAQGVLRGDVTNASAGGTPIPGATVTVLGAGRQIVSDAGGHYEGGVPIGTWDVAVYHESFAPDTTRAVVIQAGLSTEVDFNLVDVRGPAFAGTTVLSDTVDPVGPYPVESTITDFTGIAERHLYYTSSATGGPLEVVLTVINPVTGLVRGLIPGQPLGARVQYWLTAADVLGNTSADPAGAPWPVYGFTVSQSTVVASDNMETDTGWQVNLDGSDTATTGIWTRVDPNLVVDVDNASRTVSPGDDHTPDPGVTCWVTGQDPTDGMDQGTDDVDNGATTLYSPVYDLSAYTNATVSYWRWYTNDTGNSPGQDFWRVQVTADGATWIDLENTSASQREWAQQSFVLGNYIAMTASVRLRFIADDTAPGSIVEALVDDFLLTGTASVVDLTAPTVTLTYPNGGQVFDDEEEVMVTWTAQDDIGVVQARIYWVEGTVEHLLDEGALNGSYRLVMAEHLTSLPRDLIVGRLKVVVLDGAQRQAADSSDADLAFDITTAVGELPAGRLALGQNQPNPFNPRTVIAFSLPRAQVVNLRIYDVQGKLVRTLVQGLQPAGVHEVAWQGEADRGGRAASGLYFYRLDSEDGQLVRKMLLLK